MKGTHLRLPVLQLQLLLPLGVLCMQYLQFQELQR